jgi:hypothetical protein
MTEQRRAIAEVRLIRGKNLVEVLGACVEEIAQDHVNMVEIIEDAHDRASAHLQKILTGKEE